MQVYELRHKSSAKYEMNTDFCEANGGLTWQILAKVKNLISFGTNCML